MSSKSLQFLRMLTEARSSKSVLVLKIVKLRLMTHGIFGIIGAQDYTIRKNKYEAQQKQPLFKGYKSGMNMNSVVSHITNCPIFGLSKIGTKIDSTFTAGKSTTNASPYNYQIYYFFCSTYFLIFGFGTKSLTSFI